MLGKVRALLGAKPMSQHPDPKELVKLAKPVQKHKHFSIQPTVLQSEEGIYLPIYQCFRKDKPEGIVLYFHDGGIAELTREGGPIEKLTQAKKLVIAVDVRGIGETQTQKKAWYNKKFGTDAGDAVKAYLLGQSYVGMRAFDMCSVTKWVKGKFSSYDLHLVATGRLCVPALHVAALEQNIYKTIKLIRPLQSWSSALNTPITERQYGNLVHGALQVYDLPDLAATLGKRLTIEMPLDAAGKPTK